MSEPISDAELDVLDGHARGAGRNTIVYADPRTIIRLIEEVRRCRREHVPGRVIGPVPVVVRPGDVG